MLKIGFNLRFLPALLSAFLLMTACKKTEPDYEYARNYPGGFPFRLTYTDAATGADLVQSGRLSDSVYVNKLTSNYDPHRNFYLTKDSNGHYFFGLPAGNEIPFCGTAEYTPPRSSFRDTFVIHLSATITDTLLVEQNERWATTLFDYRTDKAYQFPVAQSATGQVHLLIAK